MPGNFGACPCCDPGIKPLFLNNIPSSATFFFFDDDDDDDDDNDDDDYDVYDNQITMTCQTFIDIDSLHLLQILSRT